MCCKQTIDILFILMYILSMSISNIVTEAISAVMAITGSLSDVKIEEYNTNPEVQVMVQENVVEENQSQTPDYIPYYENTQEYDAYVERQKRGKTVGQWGAGMTWQHAAQSTNVPLSYTPEVGATCLERNMLYTVIGFDGTTLKLKNHLGTTDKTFVNGQCLFIL